MPEDNEQQEDAKEESAGQRGGRKVKVDWQASLVIVQLSGQLSALQPKHLLSFPSSFFSDSPSLKSINSIAALHHQHLPSPPEHLQSLCTLLPPTPPFPNPTTGFRRARHDWLSLLLMSPSFLYFSSSFISPLPLPLPPPSFPPLDSLSSLSLPPSFSAADARRALSPATPAPLDRHLDALLLPPPTDEELRRVWHWIRNPPATPREAGSHWRVLHGRLTTRRRRWCLKVAPDDACIHCGARDDLPHALFLCPLSAGFWSAYTSSLTASLGNAFSSTSLSHRELLLGLPTLKGQAPKSARPLLRAVVAVGFQTPLDARWARIRPANPTSTLATSDELAQRGFIALSQRMN
ncbi:hypothetical protein JCM8547_008292 [Rhodosporidiobolus lusitaniae]